MIQEALYDWKVDFKFQKEWRAAPLWLAMSCGAVGGGLFLSSVFFKSTEYTLGMTVGYILLVVAKAFFLLLDLGRPQRALYVLRRPTSSWISIGSWALAIFTVTGLLYLLPFHIDDIDFGDGVMDFLKIASIITASVLIIYEGFSLFASKGVAFWNSGMVPLLFGITALTSGTGLYLGLKRLFDTGKDMGDVTSVNAALLVLSLLFLVTFLISMATASRGGKRSVSELLGGSLAVTFLVGVVLVGLIVPLAIIGPAALGADIPPMAIGIAGIVEIIGVVLLRYSIIRAGMNSPVL